jgi:hypothetical protein
MPAVTVSVICFIPLVLMRAVRNLVAPPIVIITDSKEFAFNFPTRYRIDVSKVRNLYHETFYGYSSRQGHLRALSSEGLIVTNEN